MASNNFSVLLTPEEQQAILDQVDALAALLLWAQPVSAEERKRRVKAADASEAFISQALQLGKNYPTLVPGTLDIWEMEKDVQMRPFLKDLRSRLQALTVKVDDALMLSSSEAFEAGREIYAGARHFGRGMGIDDQIQELAKRFKQSRSSSAQATSTPVEG